MSVRNVYGSSTSLGALLDAKEQASMKIHDIPLPPGGFTRRISYLSATLFAIADNIGSIVNLIFSSFDALVHLFQDQQLNETCVHCYMYIDLSLSTIYIGLVGSLMPSLADALGGNLLKQIDGKVPKQSSFPIRWLRAIRNYFLPFLGPTLEEALVEEQLDRISRSREV
jgi:hypothetical protein